MDKDPELDIISPEFKASEVFITIEPEELKLLLPLKTDNEPPIPKEEVPPWIKTLPPTELRDVL